MINISIDIKSKKWIEEKNIEKFIEKTCYNLLSFTDLEYFIRKKNIILEIGISLVSNNQIRKINHEFRNKNKPTNVLSFPFIDEKLSRKIGIKKMLEKSNYNFLGDIIIAFEILKTESKNQNKTFKNHLSHMILHSILHLIGYDHNNKKMRKEMEELEIKILKKINIKNPYLS